MNPTRLLLVEDDAVSRGFLNLALESMPATVVDLAVDGAQALEHVREQAHALWLLDANLPDTRGEALLAELRALRPGVPALCLTAETESSRCEALRAAGFADVLLKPLPVAELQRAVRVQLSAKARPADVYPTVWDDAVALQALGGNAASVQAMRALFVAELPAQAETILRALDDGAGEIAQYHLHRLKASCGFTGCVRLSDAVRALAAAPYDHACVGLFRAEVATAIKADQPSV